jgi:hypothetical protein
MAKLSDLISCTSEVTGVPFPTVQEVSRRLRESGLIQTGKGGRYGGIDMTPSDAASLLTSLLILGASFISLSKIVGFTRSHLRNFKSYSPRGSQGRLVLDTWSQKLALPQLCRLKRGHTFGDSLTALISSISNGDIKQAIADWASGRPHGVAPFFEIEARIIGPRPHSEAQIKFRTAAFDEALIYLHPRDAKTLTAPDLPRKARDVFDVEPRGFDMAVSASVFQETLTAVGHLLSEGDKTK